MELTPGFKQTEIGPIPEDWDFTALDREISALEAGISVNSTGRRPSGDAKGILKTSCVSKGLFLPLEVKEIASRDIERATTSARGDTVVISRMNTYDLVGESGYVCKDYPSLFLPDRLWMTRMRPGSMLEARWLVLMLNHAPLRAALRESATGTSGSMKNISKSAVMGLEIPLPSLPEQRAIAEVLGDMDGLLDAYDRQIDKARHVKLAAMQALLSGRTRLPGFSAPWTTTTLGDLLILSYGRSQKVVAVEGGSVPVFATGGQIGWASEALHQGPAILIGRKGTIDNPYLVKSPFWATDTTYWCVEKPNYDIRYISEVLSSIDWASYNESSGLPSLSAATIKSIPLRMPSLPEQRAIAAMLSDMDAEIDALVALRAKTAALKTGLMQQLLTGRTRLPGFGPTA